MRLRGKITFLIMVLASVILTFSFYLTTIAVYAVAKICNIEIAYKYEKTEPFFRQISFTDLKVIDKKRNIGFAARSGTVIPKWDLRSPVTIGLNFNMEDVGFIKKIPEVKEAYDTLSGLVYAPFASQWKYEKMSGSFKFFKDGIHFKDFTATSRDIRFSLNGYLYYNNSIESDIVIYFSDNVSSKIPEELSEVILRDEEDNRWKSLSVSLKGDYRTPSIQVSSKMFRLNIGTFSGSR